MNEIVLQGRLTNVRPSHTTGNIEYYAANLICNRETIPKDDNIDIIFKKLCYPYADTNVDNVTIVGNVRSFSERVGDKNNVSIYVFTYFDRPTEMYENESNHFEINGRICKKDSMYVSQKGKRSIHFILANNLVSRSNTTKLNSYLPCAAWGDTADEVDKFSVGDHVKITGELHSREYKKQVDGELQIRVAHELYITSIQKDEHDGD